MRPKPTDKLIEIRHDRFYGEDNLNDPTSLAVENGSRQVKALNCSITPDNLIERRAGYKLITSGTFKDIWSSAGTMFGIKDGDLVRIYRESGSIQYETLWYGVGDRILVYADTGNGVYISDGTVLKVFRDGALSGVANTTDAFKIRTPAGTILEYHKARLYVVVDNLLYITEAANFDIVDMRTGIRPFPSDIRMVKAVRTGLYLSDSHRTYFLRDIQPVAETSFDLKMFHYAPVLDYPAIKGTGRRVANIITASGVYSEAIMWTSERGICIGGTEGQVENLTERFYAMPSIIEGVDIYQKPGNLKQYITLLRIRR